MGTDAIDKRARIHEPHVRPLNAAVVRWRGSGDGARFVPWFDPDGAGVAARVLLLMESPGPRTVAAADLGFSSLDNQDPTSRRLREAMGRSRLDEVTCLRWNVVPWARPADGPRRPPTIDDLEEARPALSELLEHLTHLRAVVTFGSRAWEGWMRYLTMTGTVRLVPTLAVPHPSPTNGHRRHEALERTIRALDLAGDLCD